MLSGHFRPGWVWSKHAGTQTGKESEAHIGYIQSGALTQLHSTAVLPNGRYRAMLPHNPALNRTRLPSLAFTLHRSRASQLGVI